MGGPCACAAITGVKGEAVSVTRATSGTCTKGLESSIANGDVVKCGNNLPRVMAGNAGGPLGVLSEAQRINLALRSEEFDNTAWASFTAGVGANPSKGAANTDVAPDMTTTAERVTFEATGAGDSSGLSQAVLTAAAYSGSLYWRGNATTASGTVDLCIETAASWSCVECNYSLGAWARCSLPNITSKTAGRIVVGNLSSLNGGTARAAQTPTLWGGQAEAGGWVTSYIPTAATSAQRNAETISVTLSAGNAVGPNFSLAASVSFLSATVSASNFFGFGLAGQNAILYRTSNTAAGYQINAVTTAPAVAAIGTAIHRSALFDNAGTRGAFWDGASVAAPAATLPAAQTVVWIGAGISGAAPTHGVVSQLCLDKSPTRCR